MPTSPASPAPSESRPAGFRPGDHVFFPYRRGDDRDAAVVPFLREGLARAERCAYAAPAEGLVAIEARMTEAGIDVRREVSRGALRLIPAETAYRPDGAFDPDRTIDFLGGELERALADGFTGLRGAGELDFPVAGPLREAAHRYETKVNQTFAGRPFTALCSFCCTGAGALAALDMLHTHPSAFIDGTVRENPFYESPSLAPEEATPRPETTRALRAELQALRRSLRGGVTPPAVDLLAQIERVWHELRLLEP